MNIHKKAIKPSTDGNQSRIVRDLRRMGAQVHLDHDDIIVDYKKTLWWIEVKNESPFYKSDPGKLKKNTLRPNQKKLLSLDTSNYAVCWTTKGAIDFMNGKDGDYLTPAKYRGLVLMKRWGR